MTTHRRRWAPTLAVPVAVMVVVLAGCSSDDDSAPTGGGETAGDTASPSATESPITTSPPDLPVPPEVRGSAGAVDDVDWEPAECPTAAGEQTTGGSLANPTDDPAGYLVTISWTNATSDVLGLGFEVVRGVKPGEEREWEVAADVSEGAVQCVINVRRGTIRK